MSNLKAQQELHKAFDMLNNHYYEGKLPEAEIAILSTLNPRRDIYGWFTFDKRWQTEDGEVQKHEIAISAEWMKRGLVEVIHTLHHEMIHFYCQVNGIKDTSKKGKYHKEEFKNECLKRDLVIDLKEPDPKHGWYRTRVTPEFTKVVEGFGIDDEAFKLYRVIPPKKKKNRKPKLKYVCPECGSKVTATKPVSLTCTDCEVPFEQS